MIGSDESASADNTKQTISRTTNDDKMRRTDEPNNDRTMTRSENKMNEGKVSFFLNNPN
jgi:hypothetical protein